MNVYDVLFLKILLFSLFMANCKGKTILIVIHVVLYLMYSK